MLARVVFKRILSRHSRTLLLPGGLSSFSHQRTSDRWRAPSKKYQKSTNQPGLTNGYKRFPLPFPFNSRPYGSSFLCIFHLMLNYFFGLDTKALISTRSKGTNQWNFIWKKTLTRELSLVFPVWWCFSFFFQSGFSRNIFSNRQVKRQVLWVNILWLWSFFWVTSKKL